MKVELQIMRLRGEKADCPKPSADRKSRKSPGVRRKSWTKKKQSKERLMIRSI